MSRIVYAVMVFYFNPRSREGSDKGARTLDTLIKNFNPRSREGSDVSVQIVILQLKISIHAPARERPWCMNSMMLLTLFQSALPRGERLFLLLSSCYLLHISIRAPARGATKEIIDFPNILHISIRAPARGATIRMCGASEDDLFQSALPRGERRCPV